MMHKISFSYKTTCANCHMPSKRWKQLMPHCSNRTPCRHHLRQDCRAIRTACSCLNSLRIRVETRANVTERAVISRQLQLMQVSVQPRPTEDLNTADTSCPSRTSAEHFDDKPGPCPKNWTLQKIFALLTQAAFFESLPNISLKSTVFAGGASRLQACINAVELAIIANSIALDTVLKAVCTTRVLCSSQWRWCLEKNYWADSESALNAVATAVILTLDHVSPPVSPFSFLTTLVATRCRRCLLRSAWVNVMPEWLLSVISGILAGGSPVSALSFVASFTLLYGLLVFFRVVFVLLLFLAILMMTHKMSSCISFLRAGSDPTSLCLVWFLVLLCFGVFCLFAFFWFVLCLMGLLTGLCIGPLPALLRLSTDRRPCMIIYNSSFCCGWTCVTTWRKPWRRWTEKKNCNCFVLTQVSFHSSSSLRQRSSLWWDRSDRWGS